MKNLVSAWEWTLLWSSLENFLMLSEDDCEYWIRNFVTTNEDRLTIDQQLALQEIIKNKMSAADRVLSTAYLWEKLLSYLDPGNRYLVTTLENSSDGEQTQLCFMYNGFWMPVEKYKQDPSAHWMVITDLISDIKQMASLN